MLGNPISNAIDTNTILRCFTRNWKSKVTAIKEANNLATLILTTLFGKLEEHEQEFTCLDKHEKKLEKKKKKEKDTDKEEGTKYKALRDLRSRS